MDWRKQEVLNKIAAEHTRAEKLFNPMVNPHEGYAVIKEELDELWDEVKKKPGMRCKASLKKEAIQVGAMALRFILDLC
jgi:hypothetical protein